MRPPTKRILVVEDQRLIAADLQSTLEKLGYVVVGSVARGEDAVQSAADLVPDLILMDIRLRGEMDGIQAAAEIRKRLDVPLVFLTAYVDEDTISRARETSPSGYLVKPFNERELRATIEMALSKYETDRMLVEERASRRAAEEFRLLVDCVQDYSIIMLDPLGRVASWNKGARRIEGYSAEEILGKHFSIFHTQEQIDEGVPQAALAAAVRDERHEGEGWRVRKDGSRFWANVVVTAIHDEAGRLHGFGKVTRDLTERMRVEAQRRLLDRITVAMAASLELETTLRQGARILVSEVADWCLVDLVEDDGRLVPVAAAHADAVKDALAQELARSLVPPAGPSAPPDNGALRVFMSGKAELHAVLAAGEECARLLATPKVELVEALGATSCICVPLRFRGRIVGTLSLLQSGPERRFTEQDLAFAEEIAQRFAMAVDNARLYDRAQVAIQARDEFLQIASHELKTPLTPLQLQLEMLARTLDVAGSQNGQLAAKLTKATEKIAVAARQTTRLTRLVESLLDVSRITAGRIVLDLETLDAGELVRELVERFRSQAKSAGSELTVRAESGLESHWDRLRVEQILSCLISNAIKYGRGQPIEVELHERSGSAVITVTDHGIGIEPAAVGRIFDRFERAVSSRHFGGLGLGLFIARQLAEAHHGTIVAESQLGTGSRFSVVLPTSPPLPSEALASKDAR